MNADSILKEAVGLFRVNLRKVRGAKGLTGKQVSVDCELSTHKWVNDIEEGKGIPSLKEVCVICKYLHQDINDMLFHEISIEIKFTNQDQ